LFNLLPLNLTGKIKQTNTENILGRRFLLIFWAPVAVFFPVKNQLIKLGEKKK
jgi:hypothetical protein